MPFLLLFLLSLIGCKLPGPAQLGDTNPAYGNPDVSVMCPASTDLSSDTSNCGECGLVCPADYLCLSGVCKPPQVDCAIFLSSSGGSDSNPGTSWAAAKATLQAAYDQANASGCSEVWATKGTYSTLKATGSHQIRILGGFSGTESASFDRASIDTTDSTPSHWTYLDGQHTATHVIEIGDGNQAVALVVDGLWVANGHAYQAETFPADSGGGILVQSKSTLTLSNSLISGNEALGAAGGGGGIANAGTLKAVNMRLFDNESKYTGTNSLAVATGGGIQNFGLLTLERAVFWNNKAAAGAGLTNAGTATLTESIFASNQAVYAGGIGNLGALSVTNCTFFGNTTTQQNGDSILAAAETGYTMSISVDKSILWGSATQVGVIGFASGATPNISVTNSHVQGGYTGVGNSSADPLFVSTTDLHLQPGSPAIGKGAL